MLIMNNTGVHYDLARLTRILIIFDPIEPEEDDYNYVPPTTDPDLNPEQGGYYLKDIDNETQSNSKFNHLLHH